MDLPVTSPCESLHQEHSPVHWDTKGIPALECTAGCIPRLLWRLDLSLLWNCEVLSFKLPAKRSVGAYCLQKQPGFVVLKHKPWTLLLERASDPKPPVQLSTHLAHSSVYRFISENTSMFPLYTHHKKVDILVISYPFPTQII